MCMKWWGCYRVTLLYLMLLHGIVFSCWSEWPIHAYILKLKCSVWNNFTLYVHFQMGNWMCWKTFWLMLLTRMMSSTTLKVSTILMRKKVHKQNTILNHFQVWFYSHCGQFTLQAILQVFRFVCSETSQKHCLTKMNNNMAPLKGRTSTYNDNIYNVLLCSYVAEHVQSHLRIWLLLSVFLENVHINWLLTSCLRV